MAQQHHRPLRAARLVNAESPLHDAELAETVKEHVNGVVELIEQQDASDDAELAEPAE